MPSFQLRAAQKLKKRDEYFWVAQAKQLFTGKVLLVQWRVLEKQNFLRFGITVTKKYGKAVERNLFKRRIRECFRLHSFLLNRGVAMNVKPRLSHKDQITHKSIEEDFLKLLSILSGNL